MRVLIAPDKFKGTLSAKAVATAIARGWMAARPRDELELLPMSDGGDGFGEIISKLLGAKRQRIKTCDAAHRTIEASWWWDAKRKTAVIESAKIVGLAMLPPGRFHPFNLDTFGLGKVLQAAAKKGARRCIIGIGGSATNDGGFGMARALGWQFYAESSTGALEKIDNWPETAETRKLIIVAPTNPTPFAELTIAVDVKNKLLGAKGCSRIYGPQKGLREQDFAKAERCLKAIARSAQQVVKADYTKTPGAGAAGGLGFGLMTFVGGVPLSGFDIFARLAKLNERLSRVDLVITGEGAIDSQTTMGKGTGQLARLCRTAKVPCLAMAGTVLDPKGARRVFVDCRGLTDIVTPAQAKESAAKHLRSLAFAVAQSYR